MDSRTQKLIWSGLEISSPNVWAEFQFYTKKYISIEVFQNFYVKEKYLVDNMFSPENNSEKDAFVQVFRNVERYNYKINYDSNLAGLIRPFLEGKIPHSVMQDELHTYIWQNFVDVPPMKPIEDNFLKIHFANYYNEIYAFKSRAQLNTINNVLTV